MVVDNRPGANGGLGLTAVQRAPADGLTVLFTLTSFVQNRLLYANVGYGLLKDIAPGSEAGRLPIVFTVSTRLGVDSLAGFVEKARAARASCRTARLVRLERPPVHGAAAGRRGIQLLQVPYKGEAPSITDLLGGSVDAVFVSAHGVSPHVAAGKARSIAVVGTARAPLAAEVPPSASRATRPWTWSAGSACSCPPARRRPSRNACPTPWPRSFATPRRSRASKACVIPVGSTPEQLTQTMRADQAVRGRVVKDKNIRLE